MSHITIDLATLTPHEARGFMALLSHIALLEQEVKAQVPPTTLVPSSTSDRLVAEDMMRDTVEPEPVKAETQVAVEEPAKRRGRPKKEVAIEEPKAEAPAAEDTLSPLGAVETAPEPIAPAEQGPDLSALKNALGHVMQHKGGSTGALDLLERFGCRRISEVAELSAAKRTEFVKLAMSADAAEVA